MYNDAILRDVFLIKLAWSVLELCVSIISSDI